ncbi:MAG: hypothetical protein ACLP50_05960, partial [Solirubrobacteraceae bacterium]
VLVEPFVGVLLLVGLTPVVSGFKHGLIVPHLRPSEALIVWLVPLVILAARKPVRPWGMLEWLGLAYAAATFLLGGYDLWRRGAPFDSSNLDGLLGPIQYVLLLRAVRIGVRTPRERDIVVRTLVLAAAPVALLALAQGFGVVWAQHLGRTLTGRTLAELGRATGVFTNWQVLAGYLLAVGLIACAVAAYRAERILTVRTSTVLALLLGAGVARTLTIGAFLGFAIGSGALVMAAQGIRIGAARLAALLALALALAAAVLAARYRQQFVAQAGQSPSILPRTLVDRWDIWTQQYLPSLSGRWVTGFGPDIPPDVTWRFTDSVYLTFLLRGGLILLGIYGWLMAGFAVVARRAILLGGSIGGAGTETRAVGAALLTLVLVLIPLQALATYFTTSGLPEVIWILAALVSLAAAQEPVSAAISPVAIMKSLK